MNAHAHDLAGPGVPRTHRAWCKQHERVCGLDDTGVEQEWHDQLCDCGQAWGLCDDVTVEVGGAYFTDLHYEEPRTT